MRGQSVFLPVHFRRGHGLKGRLLIKAPRLQRATLGLQALSHGLHAGGQWVEAADSFTQQSGKRCLMRLRLGQVVLGRSHGLLGRSQT